VINVKDHGVFGDGLTDDTSALQALLAATGERETLYFPVGHYKVSATLDIGSKALNFRGDGKPQPFNVWLGGTLLTGTVAGPLLKSVYPAGQLSVVDFGFANLNPTGKGVEISGSQPSLERVSVNAYQAITLGPSVFTCVMRGVSVRWGANTAGSYGIATHGHTMIHAADVVGFDVGIRATGLSVDIRACRIEVNKTGVQLGVKPDGSTWQMSGAVIEALSLEANDVGVECRALACCSLRGIVNQGTVNSPSAGSRIGIWVNSAQNCEFSACLVTGGYSEASIKAPHSTPQRWSNVLASNTVPAPAKVWDVAKSVVFEQCV
jgi:hypothetical protein